MDVQVKTRRLVNYDATAQLSTCHANGTADALRRLETMVMMSDVSLPLPAVREQIVSSLDLIVQVARRPNGGRAVAAVGEVTEELDRLGRPVVRPLMADGRLVDLPERPSRVLGSAPPDPGWLAP